MENVDLGTWLLQQAPVVVVMGVVIYWLAQRLVKAEEGKDLLSKDVIKLMTLWEERTDNDKQEQIIQLLTEIKAIVSQR